MKICFWHDEEDKQCTEKAQVMLAMSGHYFPMCNRHNVILKTMTARDDLIFGDSFIEIIKDEKNAIIGVRYKSARKTTLNSMANGILKDTSILRLPDESPEKCVHYLNGLCKTGGRCIKKTLGTCRRYRKVSTENNYTNKTQFIGKTDKPGYRPNRIA